MLTPPFRVGQVRSGTPSQQPISFQKEEKDEEVRDGPLRMSAGDSLLGIVLVFKLQCLKERLAAKTQLGDPKRIFIIGMGVKNFAHCGMKIRKSTLLVMTKLSPARAKITLTILHYSNLTASPPFKSSVLDIWLHLEHAQRSSHSFLPTAHKYAPQNALTTKMTRFTQPKSFRSPKEACLQVIFGRLL
ncbi:hypothetical protein CEXT_557821 [Caerostris extrusa]|uniref:Uncharacterized protein n=1 Tax=Caerostris extrusa TaxID=172846 RepID=A0AAV4MDM5_CAEEX|nr:hypothetical protein CEXT_557821 [Caerostris extrusa]